MRQKWLKDRLNRLRDRAVVILIHHPPFRTYIDWMDVPDPEWGDGLESIVAGHANIKAMWCGHLHRPINRLWAGVPVTVAASIGSQVVLDIQNLAMPRMGFEPPGFALHVWTGDAFVSHHALIEDYPSVAFFGENAEKWGKQKRAIIERGTVPKHD